jgi:hypothetical protein
VRLTGRIQYYAAALRPKHLLAGGQRREQTAAVVVKLTDEPDAEPRFVIPRSVSYGKS